MHEEVELEPKQLLTALNENLNNRFYASPRDVAKQIYQGLADGKQAPFMKINIAEAGEVICDLALDYSEYVGKLSFSKFRKALAMMMLGIKERTEQDLPLNQLTSENGDVLFNIPGIHEADGITNVMVCGLSQPGPGHVKISLMYLNPQSYREAAVSGSANT